MGKAKVAILKQITHIDVPLIIKIFKWIINRLSPYYNINILIILEDVIC